MIENDPNKTIAITQLTQDGLQTLLFDNINFEIAGFTFIDDEVNYNLFNPDQNIAKGFDRINYYDSDIDSDVLSLNVLDPTYRVQELNNYLFGDPILHQLTPDQIRTAYQVIQDMFSDPINLANEITSAKNVRGFDFEARVLSGSFNPFVLTDSELFNWSVGIDIRGTVTAYQNSTETVLIEQSNVFDKLSYTVRFLSSDGQNNSFEYTKIVQPDEPLTISTKDLITQLQINYQLYGTFYVYKTFTLEGVDYTSDTLQIITKPDKTQFGSKLPFDARETTIEIYSSPYLRKNVFIDFPTTNIVPPKVYGNYATDLVLAQTFVPGYISLSKGPFQFKISANKINNLTLNLENVANPKNSISYITVQGSAVDATNYITFQQLILNITLYLQQFNGGYYLRTNINIPNQFGFLMLDNVNSEDQYQFSLFGEENYKAFIKINKTIFLSTTTYFESLKGTELLWHVVSPDQDILYNYKHVAPVLMQDFENLFIDLS